jgi:outer membrane lipoprotein SlyB
MKRFLVLALMFLVFAIGLPLTAEAQTCRCRRYHRSTAHRTAYRSRSYGTQAYVAKRPSFYRRHRNMINMGIGAGAGALVGGLIGGRRGVGYGLLAGTGAGALYTYKLNPKKRRYYRNY